MKFNTYIFYIFLLFSASLFAQKTIKHTVVSGESIFSIAKKYKVTEDEIYALNPKVKDKILALKTILIIPKSAAKNDIPKENSKINTSNSKKKGSPSVHIVEQNESFYTIAQKYNVTVEDLKEFNPKVSPKKLQIGTILNLKLTKEAQTEKIKNEKPETNADESGNILHKVKKGETLNLIAEKHKLTLKALQKLNPKITSKIKIGDEIIIKKGKAKPKTKIDNNNDISIEPVVVKQPLFDLPTAEPCFDDNIEEPDDSGNVYHVVEKGETLSKISRQYNISLTKIKELNPNQGDNLRIGHKLLIKEITPLAEVVPIVKYAEIEEYIEDATPLSESALSKVDYLIARASEHIGTRYRSGGTNAGGFDCSGLMIYTFKEEENIKLPRTSAAQSGYGKKIKKAQVQKGDLIFFTTNGRGNINHVGMVTEVSDNEIKFIHASLSKGVVVSSLREPYYAKRFVKIMRVIKE